MQLIVKGCFKWVNLVDVKFSILDVANSLNSSSQFLTTGTIINWPPLNSKCRGIIRNVIASSVQRSELREIVQVRGVESSPFLSSPLYLASPFTYSVSRACLLSISLKWRACWQEISRFSLMHVMFAVSIYWLNADIAKTQAQ